MINGPVSWETLTFFTFSGPCIAIETLATGRNTDLILQKCGAITELAQAATVTLQASRRTSCIRWKAQPHWDTAKPGQPLVCRAVPRVRVEALRCVLPTWQRESRQWVKSYDGSWQGVPSSFAHCPCIKLTVLTCALPPCLVCVVSLPTFGNTEAAQEEERGWAKAALVCLVALKAGLITP